MKNMKVGRKLAVAFGVLLVLMAIITVYGANNIMNVDREYTYVLDYPAYRRSLMRDIEVGMMNARRIMNRASMYGSDVAAAGTPAAASAAAASIDGQEQLFRGVAAEIDGFMVAFRDPINRDTYMSNATKAERLASITGLETALHQYWDAILSSMASSRRGDTAGAIEITRNAMPVVDAAYYHFDTLLDEMNAYMVSISGELTATSIGTMWILIGIAFAAAVIATILGVYVSRMISTPLSVLTSFMQKAGATGDISMGKEDREIISAYSNNKDELGLCIGSTATFIGELNAEMDMLERVADGDLTVNPNILSENDKVGKALTKVVSNLNNMLAEISNSSGQVSSGSQQIADGSQSLAQGSTEQAATVQELSASITEIAEKTKDNATMADKAASLASTIKDNAERGSRQMDEMVSAVNEISQASQSISKVIKVIDDIAFQTNILALNAAVEAARAGQHGKGFAVVADEVRTLAAKSAEAAKDTGVLISNSMEKAEHGARIAKDTADSLVEIVSGINESGEIIGEIAKASDAQSSGITQINSGIDQVATVVQQNSATAEESAAAAEQLSGQSSMLRDLISQFRLKNSEAKRGELPGPVPQANLGSSAFSMGAYGSNKY